MRVYVYQAALYCEACGEDIRARLVCSGAEPADDSDSWPCGPYDHGGGESDSPQHCDACGLFLENPLTADGAAYVAERVSEGKRHGIAWRVWRPFYSVEVAEVAPHGP